MILQKTKRLLRDLAVAIFRLIGSEVRDPRTGRSLGRGLILPWRGRIHLLGFHHTLLPHPLHQPRLTYWRQTLAFTTHDELDTPRHQPIHSPPSPRVLLLLLDHRPPTAIHHTLSIWHAAGFAPDDILLAHGGPASSLPHIHHPHTIQLQTTHHLTTHHQREKQSYRELLTATTRWLHHRPHTHILFHEYDHLPLVHHLPARLLTLLQHENADLLGYELYRRDRTTHPHWLSNETTTHDPLPAISMLGTGHFWTRPAWETVSLDHTLAHWYLELDMPTTAHRHGYRLRRHTAQNPFVKALQKHRPHLEAAITAGAWTLHPVKDPASLDRILAHLQSTRPAP